MKVSQPVVKEQDLEAEIAVSRDSVNSNEELATMVAEALGAERCLISITADEQIAEVCAGRLTSFGEVHLGATTAIVEYSDARDMMFSILELNGKTIGVVQVSGPQDEQGFNGHDLKLLSILAAFTAKAVEMGRLQKLVGSPFARMTLKRSSDQTIGDIVAQSIQNPSQLSKILARSFYREMTRAGFDFGQIIGAATEIISELASNVRKSSDRKHPRAG